MFEYRHNRIAFRSCMLALCVALLASCGEEDASAAADAVPAAVTPATPVAVPPAPTGLAASSGSAQVSLTWSASSAATSYSVRRSTTNGGPYTQLASATTPAYVDAALNNGTTYYYVVAATNSAGTSANSAQASATPAATPAVVVTPPTPTPPVTPAVVPPSIPTAPSGLSATPGNAQVTLSWTSSSGATSYKVKRSTISGGQYTQIAAPTSASYSNTTLTNGTTYYYVVSAINSAGESTDSTQVSGTPVAPAPVGACDHLPAPGVWENITPPGTSALPAVNGTVATGIIVDPFDSRRLWLGTGAENDDIWRSDNCGSTWTRVNTGAGSVGTSTTAGVGDGAQWSMQADPVNPGVLYAVSGYGGQSLWKTTDGGRTWADILVGTEYERHAEYRFVNNVSLDPTDNLHLVISTHGNCSAPYGPSCIGESQDGGRTWRVMSAPEAWFEGGGLILVKGGHWIWCGSKMMVTKDGGMSWSGNALAGGGSCEAEYTIRPFVPASNGKYYLGSRNGVLRSTNGENWEHIPSTSGLLVMIAQGSRKVFVSNQWAPTVKSANLTNDDAWTDLPAPPQFMSGTEPGVGFMAYDDDRGILYASRFSGGVARMVIP
jgi:hypothetical protein